MIRVERALISVSDKTGIVDFAKDLHGLGVEILSTGGTARALRDAGIPVIEISDHTGFPEMMDGRVKTLHPKVHGGLLARRDLPMHTDAMRTYNIPPIDLLVVNLYPFRETLESGADFETCVENIDIGGPAMIRSAAKNHAHVGVVTSSEDYRDVIEELNRLGGLSKTLCRTLALKAFACTASYDSAIAAWLGKSDSEEMPSRFLMEGTLKSALRYGENPHQRAGLYAYGPARGIASATQVQGKELSYNNLADADAAYALVSEFPDPAAVIVKHANPCGVALGHNTAEAYRKALSCDPVSAFGGIVAVNRPLDVETAQAIASIFCEVVLAPSVEAGALDVFAKKPNVRLLTTGTESFPPDFRIRGISGGFLLQEADTAIPDPGSFQVVTERAPTPEEIEDMVFAMRVAKHVKSNAIVFARKGVTAGIGAGQMSRVDSVRIAAWKAAETAENAGQDKPLTFGSVVASDAFFPFADGLIAAADAGARAVIQPGGSKRDPEVIEAANERGLAMVFTGTRHFNH